MAPYYLDNQSTDLFVAMLTSHAARIGLLAVLCFPAAGAAQYRLTKDSSVSSIIAHARRDWFFPSEVVLDILQQRKGPTSVEKRRELADSLVELIVSKGESATSFDAIVTISRAGRPPGKEAGVPDPDALDRLIEIDRRLGGVLRATILGELAAQNPPRRALPYLRTIATSVMNVDAISALDRMEEMAYRGDDASPDRVEARRHLREMWDGDLVPYSPARNELVCFAERAGWPGKAGTRCHRG